MFRKYSTALLVALGLLTISPLSARANSVTKITATGNCSSYTLAVTASDLVVGNTYAIVYNGTITCGGNTQTLPLTTSASFKATSSSMVVTIPGSLSTGTTTGFVGTCTFNIGAFVNTDAGGAADFTGSFPIDCPGTPLSLSCASSSAETGTVGTPLSAAFPVAGGTPPYTCSFVPPPPPYPLPGVTSLTSTTSPPACLLSGTPTQSGTFPVEIEVTDSTGLTATNSCPFKIASSLPTACVIPPSGTAIGGAPVSWNGFTAPAGSVVWINAHLDAKNVPTNTTTTVDFTGVTLVVNTTSYALPNGQVIFNPATTTPTTIVNPDGSWTTTVNPSFNNDIFFVGQAIPVDSNLENGGHGNTGSTLSFSTNSSDSTLQFQWQWGAAVYTSWPGNAAANIEPVHAQQQAGAPLNTAVQKDLIQGPRGGGGSNFTGSWSGTGQGTCPQ